MTPRARSGTARSPASVPGPAPGGASRRVGRLRMRASRVHPPERAPQLLLDRGDVARQLVSGPLLVLDPDGRQDVRGRLPDPLMALAHDRHDFVPVPLDA